MKYNKELLRVRRLEFILGLPHWEEEVKRLKDKGRDSTFHQSWVDTLQRKKKVFDELIGDGNETN